MAVLRTGGCWAILPHHPIPTVHLSARSHLIIQPPTPPPLSQSPSPSASLVTLTRRKIVVSISTATSAFFLLLSHSPPSNAGEFSDIPGSGGVKALDLRVGTGSVPLDGDQVAIHYYGRLAAKQGWRFDSTYDHKDGSSGEPVPFVFMLGSGKVISGIEAAVKCRNIRYAAEF